MNRPPVPPPTVPPWRERLWWAAGLAFLIVAAGWVSALAFHFPRWYCTARYVPAELEVMKFNTEPGPKGQGRLIEGVIHPGTERVYASDRDLSILHFVGPGAGDRRVPTPDEIVGRRIDVWYWPNHNAEIEWWHPPPVIAPGGVTDTAILRDALCVAAFGACGRCCCIRGAGRPKLAAGRNQA